MDQLAFKFKTEKVRKIIYFAFSLNLYGFKDQSTAKMSYITLMDQLGYTKFSWALRTST